MKKVSLNVDKTPGLELIEELKKNPIFKDYDINEFNANTLYNISKEQSNCKKCKCLNMCLNDTPGFYTTISVENDSYKTEAKKCKYKQESDQLMNKNSLIKTLYVPKAFMNASFDNYNVSTTNRQKIGNYLQNFVNSYNRNNFVKGLLISGSYGIGKTYVLAALANELAKNNIESLMIYFPDLSREFKSCIGTSRLDELVNTLKSIDVLILDDLGSELMSEWLRDEIIGPIINYRVGERLPIFISTNLTIEQLTSHFNVSKNSEDLTKGSRIIKRITELVLYLEMQADEPRYGG